MRQSVSCHTTWELHSRLHKEPLTRVETFTRPCILHNRMEHAFRYLYEAVAIRVHGLCLSAPATARVRGIQAAGREVILTTTLFSKHEPR